MVWHSHLLKNFPQFIVIYTVKGFSIFKEAEINVFLEFSWFFYDPMDVGNLSLVPLSFVNSLEHLEVLSLCTAKAWLDGF